MSMSVTQLARSTVANDLQSRSISHDSVTITVYIPIVTSPSVTTSSSSPTCNCKSMLNKLIGIGIGTIVIIFILSCVLYCTIRRKTRSKDTTHEARSSQITTYEDAAAPTAHNDESVQRVVTLDGQTSYNPEIIISPFSPPSIRSPYPQNWHELPCPSPIHEKSQI
jgi:hypothetical protein